MFSAVVASSLWASSLRPRTHQPRASTSAYDTTFPRERWCGSPTRPHLLEHEECCSSGAVLLNEGNLVLRSPSPNGTVLWQSFEPPTNTILLGMPFQVNYRARLAGRLVSWKGPEDPATGDFSLSGDFSSGLQYFIWRGPNLTWHSSLWNGGTMSPYKPIGDSSAPVILTTIMADGDEITLTYTLSDGSSGLRARMSYTG
ncbi:hypothetical protein PVAP13_7KG399202 [Panicum virgatum]|uniref:non-specific serine/threonine protein kinase n=1 Tax=Panicum virgatum TaxID=38727 RepID=A0A8T0QLS7_PANVG|nr:hypothetical protein PVAP13_7KG399202 [Panicum virgatum]